MGDEHEDAALEHQLRTIAERVDPVPAAAVRVAKDGFVWRTIDAELAELEYDSLDRAGPTLVRGAAGPRLLTFRAGGLTVEVEVTAVGAESEVYGQLVPPGPATVQVRHRGGAIELIADDLGRFGPGRLRQGPVSLRLALPGEGSETHIVTEWVPV
jgi:hypothetical protein